MKPLLVDDLAHVTTKAARAFHSLAGADVAITGQTGFLGSWLLTSGLASWIAGHRVGSLLGMSRTKCESWHRHQAPFLSPGQDVRGMEIPAGTTHVIHCANAGDGAENENAEEVERVIVDGTRRVASECARVGARLLVVSSSSVYDATLPRTAWGVGELHPVAATRASGANAFGRAKAVADESAVAANPNTVVARCFPLIGPRLPSHLVAAQMMEACALHAAGGGRVITAPFEIRDGQRCRSYLYAADAAAWLWHLLAFGETGEAYNVGSPHPCTLGALAGHFAGLKSGACFHVDNTRDAGAPLLPSLTKMRNLAGEAWCEVRNAEQGVQAWWRWENAQ